MNVSSSRVGSASYLKSPTTSGILGAVSLLGIGYTLARFDITSVLFPQRQCNATTSAVSKTSAVESRCYNAGGKQSLKAFKVLTEQATQRSTYPLAIKIEKNIPVYDSKTFDLNHEDFVFRLQDELYHVLLHGPGIFVLRNFYTSSSLLCIDSANTAYETIIAREAIDANGKKGDHFAAGGANSRIWNSFSKHCLVDPESFFAYFSNPLFKLVSESYLGPAYRITSQVNIVRPGGKPQVSHRDYHLGFQTTETCSKWPAATHDLSALLTLQGAVAHADMPLESGPTRFLPFSQQFKGGYMAYRDKDFDDYFLDRWVSLPLRKGDAVFFSPGLHHGAGENTSKDVERSANLIQVSSAFGKTMETIDALPLVERTWDLLLAKYELEGWSDEVEAFICAIAEGYPFPTNLDRRPPAPGGMAPESEQDLLRRGLGEGWDSQRTVDELVAMREASKA
ncbi:hypothetical protein K431DRAFT_286565 [Polychaeton citri CBS 116435]|uniref:PhyH-domain-containing protein n=1 Tax=Polychaeton citri CBS 116435 TaxID=1314669 RepID=A0A9P4Q4Z3_9PEZI|nr:hypothetical protein K431DRAFT_286565 [Polychaeton citri CBS 116435]